jgi:hypothetical protein
MKKFGTPIAAGPGTENANVGLDGVGTPVEVRPGVVVVFGAPGGVLGVGGAGRAPTEPTGATWCELFCTLTFPATGGACCGTGGVGVFGVVDVVEVVEVVVVDVVGVVLSVVVVVVVVVVVGGAGAVTVGVVVVDSGGQDSETLTTPGGRLSEEIGAPGGSW